MRLIQLTDNNTQNSIGLYTCSKPISELSKAEVEGILQNFHDLNDEGKYDEADELIEANGIERIYIEEEIYVN